MDGSVVCGIELHNGGVDGVLFMADGAGMADAAGLSLSSGDFGGGVCVVVGLSGSLCGFCGACEFSEPDARGGVADDVYDDGVNCTTVDAKKGYQCGNAGAGRDVFSACNGEYTGVLDAWGMVYVDDPGLGNELYLGVFAIDDSG